MSNKSEAAILKNLEKLAVHNDPIDQKLYSQYDVKRGLRMQTEQVYLLVLPALVM